jgi:hypothetical protein
MSGRDDDRDERPRRSWREIDRMRDGSGHRPDERKPRGKAAEARSRQATQSYLKQIDGLFARDGGGAEGERLARALRAAHGTPGLAEACAAYRDALGFPSDPELASLFLDCGERELVAGALTALAAAHTREPVPLGSGLRSQLRLLAEDPDDEIAGAAEDLLGG